MIRPMGPWFNEPCKNCGEKADKQVILDQDIVYLCEKCYSKI